MTKRNLVVIRQIPCYNCRVLNQNSFIKQFCWIKFCISYNVALILGNWLFFFVIFNSLTVTRVPTSEIKWTFKLNLFPTYCRPERYYHSPIPRPHPPYISSLSHSTAWHLTRSKLNLHYSNTPQAQLNSALIEADLYMPNSHFSIY